MSGRLPVRTILLMLVGITAFGMTQDNPFPPIARSPMCGANCLFALHALAGDDNTNIADIAAECDFDWEKGISLLNIRDYLLRHGFKVRAEKISPNRIRSGSYYLIPVRSAGAAEYNHYCLILSKDEGRLRYYNGSGKVETKSVAEMSAIWDGEALIVSGKGIEDKTSSMTWLSPGGMRKSLGILLSIMLVFLLGYKAFKLVLKQRAQHKNSML